MEMSIIITGIQGKHLSKLWSICCFGNQKSIEIERPLDLAVVSARESAET